MIAGAKIREANWPTNEAGIDPIQPFMTPEEFAAWDKMRAEDKAFQLSQWDKWCRELEALFDDPTERLGAIRPEEAE